VFTGTRDHAEESGQPVRQIYGIRGRGSQLLGSRISGCEVCALGVLESQEVNAISYG
jgi:hypothetical protein